MKIKIYLNEWMINAGIVGFINIYERQKSKTIQKNENYIEIDTEELRDFDKCYFDFFFNQYNIAEKLKNQNQKVYSKIKTNSETKEIEKELIKQINANIKYQNDKIKKFNPEIGKEIEEIIKQNNEIKDIEQLDELKNNIEIVNQLISKEEVNKKITLNAFKAKLSADYFGQISIFNVSNNGNLYNQQQSGLYRDYISSIVEEGYINDILQGKYNLEQIEEYISKAIEQDNIVEEIKKIYKQIKTKYIQKNKTIQEIIDYLKSIYNTCFLCGDNHVTTTQYSEGNFIPLAISNDKMSNLFWDANTKLPICSICKLLLLCVPAGVTTLYKTYREIGKDGKISYSSNESKCFINRDTTIEKLCITNRDFMANSRIDKSEENPFSLMIKNIVKQEKEISEWELKNILVIEFESEYRGYSRIQYFHINKYVARFLRDYSEKTIEQIRDRSYRTEVLNSILENKEFKRVIEDNIKIELGKELRNGYDAFLMTKARAILRLLKKEVTQMESVNIKKNIDKLYVVYNLGIQIHEELKLKNELNKLDAYIFKMLNSIKSGNKKEFMDVVIRLNMYMQKDIPSIFIECLGNGNIDLASIGHAYISGLISNKYQKEDKEGEN